VPKLSLDAASAEERLRLEPVDHLTPEAIFERQWAATLVARCLERLRREQLASGAGDRFERLKAFLTGDGASGGAAALARELGVAESTLRVQLLRLRRRFAAVLREEVARTVAQPGDVDAEIRFLLEALRDGSERA
jgi:RNA polymerase sigma-70 factor (ECF subfamily)